MDVVDQSNGVRARGRAARAADDAAESDGGAQLLVWLQVHLRGRYLIVTVLAVLFGGGLGYLGYRTGAPTYRSTAYIQVVKPLAKVVRIEDPTDDLESFLAAQSALLKGGRVAASAVASPEWQQAKQGGGLDQADEFAAAVTVAAKDKMLFVSFDDADPRTAAIGLKALLAEYKVQYAQTEAETNAARTGPLSLQETAANNEVNFLRGEIEGVAKEFKTDDVSAKYLIRAEAAERFEGQLAELRSHLQAATQPTAARPAADYNASAGLIDQMDIEELAQRDTALRGLVAERVAGEQELRRLTVGNKFGDTHPAVERAVNTLAQLEADIAVRAQAVRTMLKRPRPATATVLDVGELDVRIKATENRLNFEAEEVRKLGVANRKLNDLKARLRAAEDKARALRGRYDQITLETTNANRVLIPTEGMVSAKPVTDTRPRFAAVGAVLGLILAVGLVLLPALLDRRFRSADHTRTTRSLGPILGVLPELPEHLTDESATAIAAHSVHRTRTLLQAVHRGRAGAQILGVTSSQAGTGKTSLALALGVSYATAGSRTLLVDCDLVGGGLSGRVGQMMRRRVGDVLVDAGVITPEQLADAILRTTPGGRRLGEVCVELGYAEQGDVERAMDLRCGRRAGIMDALDGAHLDACVSETGFPGLQVLPLGGAEAADCASISPAKL
ncbi:MAG TPA: hypothetical protein VK986_15580, partial [Tepidisphaeraceae bacterium]|nr:hypothetical protein [Tepidisphaeraceae bacterium]